MSTRIRRPSLKSTIPIIDLQEEAVEPASVRRKSSKRLIPHPEEDYYFNNDHEKRTSQSRQTSSRPPTKRARTGESFDDDMDVDIEGDVDMGGGEDTRLASESEHESRTARLSRASSAGSQKRNKSRGKAERTPAPVASTSGKSKKKRQVVYSDDDEYEGYEEYEEARNASRDVRVDDDFETPSKHPVLKIKISKSGNKGKARGKEKEEKMITMKDERKVVHPAPKSSTKDEEREIVTKESLELPPAVAEAPKEASSTPLPSFKKRKLPTIKKNKVESGASTTSNTMNQPPAVRARARPADTTRLAGDAMATDDGLPVLKKPAKAKGNVEVDLSNKDIYASLFKSAGANPPRAGLKKEERRKELDKMREADRARRAALTEHVFDLRAQHDKIVNFVERLTARKSSALWPNVLASSWRYERDREERRREKEHLREKAERERENGEVDEDNAS
ncbi:hypothetical protein EW146_g1839 [Bondarzewia mesenterica]|uniref:Uncharacterized protein n=1 Tax=Bondarzewia mesenterica TaxID=1095465 RepID=A0A4V3XFX9_9AGAM|nr:hypothetical protein EW146_g1839 [Bondarzewia mesenterica]